MGTFAQRVADTAFIRAYPQKYYVSGFLLTSMVLLHHKGVNYQPNLPLNAGVGFAIKNSLVNVQYSYGVIPLGKEDKGKTKSLDMQLHHYGRKVVYDVYLQRYKGFYSSNGENNNSNVSLYPDLTIKQIGGELQYFSNGDRFSTRAAFEQSERQMRSASSLVTGINAYYYAVDLGNTFPVDGDKKFDNIQIGASAGYAYSWVFGPGWLWSSILYGGINTGNDPGRAKKFKLNIYPNASAKTAIGYHGENWGAYFSMLLHNKAFYFLEGNKMQVLTLNMQMTYVRHF